MLLLVLPSERILRDYKHIFKHGVGFLLPDVTIQLASEAEIHEDKDIRCAYAGQNKD